MKGGIDVGAVILLAAPEWDDTVFCTVNYAYRTFKLSGSAIDVELLAAEHVLATDLVESEAFDELRRILRVEIVTEEMSGLAGVLDDRACRPEDPAPDMPVRKTPECQSSWQSISLQYL